MELKTNSVVEQAHLGDKGAFTFFKDKIISVADDSMMKVFQISEEGLVEESLIDMDGETYTIASNQVDKIAYGGSSCKVYVQQVETESEDGEALKRGEAYLAMSFNSSVTKVEFVGGKHLLAISEDSHAQIMDLDTLKATHFKSGAHQGSVRNAAVDPNMEFLATTGCDGTLKIVNIEANSLVQTQQISKKQSHGCFPAPQHLELIWSADGSYLYVTGEVRMQILSRSDSFKKIKFSPSVHNNEALSMVQRLAPGHVAIYGIDRILKLWSITNETDMTARLTHKMKLNKDLLSIQYCSKNATIVYMDAELTIGAIPMTLANLKAEVDEVESEMDIDEADLLENLSLSEEAVEEKKSDKMASQADVKSHKSVEKKPKQAAASQEDAEQSEGEDEQDQRPARLNKQKKMQSRADEIIDLYPQQTFVPNCHFNEEIGGKYRVLNWNMVGTVSLRKEFAFTSIDVDFMNKQFHRNLVLADDFGVEMACLNYSGLLMASKATITEIDEYEEDDIDDDLAVVDEDKKRKKSSNIQFKPFDESREVKEWNYELKNNESVECLASGSGWCCVLTSPCNYLRVFSADGIQKTLLCQGTPVVSMVGYENLLAIVSHAGPPVYGMQSMRLKVVNMDDRDYRTVVETECPVSKDSYISWMGFTEEGQFMTFDSDGIIRSFNFRNQQWTPVLDFKIKYQQFFDKLWIVGITDGEVLALELPSASQSVPHLAQKSQIRRFKLKVPLLNQQNTNVDSKELTLPQIEEQLLNCGIQLEHAQFRKENWEQLKHFRSKYDGAHALSESVPDNAEIANQKKALDKFALNAIRMCIIAGDHDKIFSYMDLMHFNQSLKLVVKLCESLKVSALAMKVNKYLNDKETQEIFTRNIPDKDSKHKASSQRPDPSLSASSNMMERRTAAPSQSQANVGFGIKAKQELNANPLKIVQNTQVSFADAEVAQGDNQENESTIQLKTQPAANPFGKKEVLIKKTLTKGFNETAIFADLKEGAAEEKPAEKILTKRPNPFAQTQAQPKKQRKLFQ